MSEMGRNAKYSHWQMEPSLYTSGRRQMFKNILIATDGSELAGHAITNGFSLAGMSEKCRQPTLDRGIAAIQFSVGFRRCGTEHVVSRHGAANALEFKFADWFDGHGIFDCHQDTGTDQDLTGLGFVAKS